MAKVKGPDGRYRYTDEGEHRKLGGRPEKWTQEKIAELADDVLAFAELPTSLDILSWRADRELTHSQVDHICGRSDRFAGAYEIAKAKIGARRCNLTYKGDFSEKLLLKQEWAFDKATELRIDKLAKLNAQARAGLLDQLEGSESLVKKDPRSEVPLEDQDEG